MALVGIAGGGCPPHPGVQRPSVQYPRFIMRGVWAGTTYRAWLAVATGMCGATAGWLLAALQC